VGEPIDGVCIHFVLDIHVHVLHFGRMSALAAYMAREGLTDEALGRLVGRERSTITKLRLGQARPSLDLAVKIAALSKGDVPPTAYAESRRGKRAIAAARPSTLD
jgi:DNA-binding XRE family transcriptional regulator